MQFKQWGEKSPLSFYLRFEPLVVLRNERNFDILAVKECVEDRICKPHLTVFSVARKEYDQECKRIKEERAKAVKEITVSLELGGTRTELEEKQ